MGPAVPVDHVLDLGIGLLWQHIWHWSTTSETPRYKLYVRHFFHHICHDVQVGLGVAVDYVLKLGIEPIWDRLQHLIRVSETPQHKLSVVHHPFQHRCRDVQVGLGVAVDYVLELGIEPIWERIQHLSRSLRKKLQALPGAHVHDLGRVLCGIVSFSLVSKFC